MFVYYNNNYYVQYKTLTAKSLNDIGSHVHDEFIMQVVGLTWWGSHMHVMVD